jgi:dienelactone hydrolase
MLFFIRILPAVLPLVIELKADIEEYDYAQEEEAYRYFLNFVDFEPSEKKITFLLRQEEKEYKQIFLLGYSAGATIAWLCGGLNVKCDGVIGFYGSRIRDYTETRPQCPVLLIYPEEEKSFDPCELREALSKKEKVEVHILDGTVLMLLEALR